MIKVLKRGSYTLIETRKGIKVLKLGRKSYVWINVSGIGEILVSTHRKHYTDHILGTGSFRLYDVKEEPEITDLMHLELLVGEGKWQGYLLLKGLPTDEKKRNRIVPTSEVITTNHY